MAGEGNASGGHIPAWRLPGWPVTPSEAGYPRVMPSRSRWQTHAPVVPPAAGLRV